jgi:hypothetical protein
VPVEAADLERSARLELRRSQPEPVLAESRPRLDQHSERGRVDELHQGEVDDDAPGPGGDRLVEGGAEVVGVVEVQFPGEAQDGATFAVIEPDHGMLTQR